MHPAPDLLVLLALGEDDDPAARAHLRTCPTCRAEVDNWAHVVSVGRSITADDVLTEPDERVWEAIRRELDDDHSSTVIGLPTAATATVAPGSPSAVSADPTPTASAGSNLAGSPASTSVPAASAPSSSGLSPRRRWPAMALAAALVLILGIGLGVGITRALADKTDVVGVTTLNALPSWKGSNGTATVEEDDAGNRTLVITAQIPATTPVDGKMEVWLGDPRAEDMVPMGTMNGPSGRFPLPKAMDLKTHPVVDVSLEPVNDTSPAHSDVSVLRGRLPV